MKLAKVFLSSTSDLAEQRDGIRNALKPLFEPYLYEHDTAGRDAPADRIRRTIARTDVFVALLGARYGSLVPGDAEERSISQWELDLARAQRGLPIRAFLLAFPADQIEERQRRFREALKNFETGMWVRPVASPAELSAAVVRELHEWLSGHLVRLKAVSPRFLRWLDRRLIPIATVAALTGVGLPVVNVIRPFITVPAAVAGSVACAVLVLACAALRSREAGGST